MFAVVSQHCLRARTLFEDVRQQYAKLAEIVPKDQYYRYHDQWRFVTQRLCFLAALIVYLEVKILVTKETVAEILGGISFIKFIEFISRDSAVIECNICF